jgi:hypothetical protein
VIRYLHQLSAVFFYLLGAAFFAAYILYRNGLGAELPLRLLTEGELPLLACAMLYGATSVILSVDDTGSSKSLRWGIGIPMLLLFLCFALLNFWERLSF